MFEPCITTRAVKSHSVPVKLFSMQCTFTKLFSFSFLHLLKYNF